MSFRKVKFFENDSVKVCPGECEEKFIVEFKDKIGSAHGIIEGLPFAFRECGIRWGDHIIVTMVVRDSRTFFNGQEITFKVTLESGSALIAKCKEKFEKLKVDRKVNVELLNIHVTMERAYSFAEISKDALPNQEAEMDRLRGLKYVYGDKDYVRLAESSDSSDNDECACRINDIDENACLGCGS